jgi:hypothetical protein
MSRGGLPRFFALASTMPKKGTRDRLSRLSCPDSPVLAVLSWQPVEQSFLVALSASPRFACPFLPVLSACAILAVLFCLSRSVCPVLFVPFWLPYSGCPVLVVLFRLSCSSCPLLTVNA